MRLLPDEHIPRALSVQLKRALPDLDRGQVGQSGYPPQGAPDSDLLIWCETRGFLLVTNNRKSMPRHLKDHLSAGHHIPGILTVDLRSGIGALLADLIDVVLLSFEDEYADSIRYLQFSE